MAKNKRVLAFLAAALCVLSVAIIAAFWKTDVSSGTTGLEEFHQHVREGLAEISLPTSNDAAAINSAADNLGNFINYRSGVQISQANKDLLKNTEQNFRSQGKKITPDQLSQILTDVAVERFPTITEAEINSAMESLRGFNHPDLPLGFKKGRIYVYPRGNGEGTMFAEAFKTEAINIRNSGLNKFMISAASSRISLEIERTINALADASPEYFGTAKSKLTPLQAILITYAIVADDHLGYNQVGLNQRMQTMQQRISQAIGEPYPAGQRAYGDNGYITPMPVSVALNDATVSRILNLIEERGSQ